MSRTAIVTGAGTGIGAATARTLAASCSTVVLVGRRIEKLEQVASEITTQHPEVTTHVKSVDLTEVQAVESFATWAIAELTMIDVLVNNAGSVQPRFAGGLQDVSDVWETTLRGNLMSAVLMTEALLPHVTSPGGRIVIVGSFAAQFGNGSIAYSAAKSALQTYVVSLTRTQGPRGITCNVVAPGFTGDTELVIGRIDEERHARLVGGIAAGRSASSQEIANVIDFLASPGASFVSGQTVTANGGVMFPG
jgi:3-oxoacyl-[acyl-carrier protein] reductase